MFDFIMQLDIKAMEFCNLYFHNPIIDPFIVSITYLGEGGILWIIIALSLLYYKKYRKTAILMGIALVCALLLVDVLLKNIIHRPRPFQLLTYIKLIIITPPSYSFPSGHASSSFAGGLMIILCLKKHILSLVAAILMLLVPFTRLYLLVHYPSDLLAGALIGAACALLVYFVYNKMFSKATPAA